MKMEIRMEMEIKVGVKVGVKTVKTKKRKGDLMCRLNGRRRRTRISVTHPCPFHQLRFLLGRNWDPGAGGATDQREEREGRGGEERRW
jgi:hypothetical protein